MIKLNEMPSGEAKRITRHRMLREYGESLLQRRKERGVTRIELSEKAEVSRKSIENVELSLADITGPQKKRIKKFLRRQRII